MRVKLLSILLSDRMGIVLYYMFINKISVNIILLREIDKDVVDVQNIKLLAITVNTHTKDKFLLFVCKFNTPHICTSTIS